MIRDIDEAEALLLKWAESMRHGGMPVEGYPEKALGFIESWRKDFDDHCDEADTYEVSKIQSAIDSLTAPHNRIIHKVHKISHMVWSFPDEAALYLAAKEAFRVRYFFATV
ncbi:Hypothetical protein mma_2207 [Janthinobacterium sp. Marseille]|nr:hypothetical protein [Janthinobacterium sp. Marseille]ABR91437.1 Hypothetical protein mma_2207 [Janthinobacterium sp. Marseille]